MSTKDEISGRKTPIEVALRRIENRPESPLVQKRTTMMQELPVQQAAKPAGVTPLSPSEEKKEVEDTKPAASKLSIPTIVVEDEPVEQTQQAPQVKCAKGGPAQKTKAKSRRMRPMSPELGQILSSFLFFVSFLSPFFIYLV
jgi:hypothetical protein